MEIFSFLSVFKVINICIKNINIFIKSIKININACLTIQDRVNTLIPLLDRITNNLDNHKIDQTVLDIYNKLQNNIEESEDFIYRAKNRGYLWWLSNRKAREVWFYKINEKLIKSHQDLQLSLIIDINLNQKQYQSDLKNNSIIISAAAQTQLTQVYEIIAKDAHDLEKWLDKNNDLLLQSIKHLKTHSDESSIITINEEMKTMISDLTDNFKDLQQGLIQGTINGDIWLSNQRKDISQSFQYVKDMISTLSPSTQPKIQLPSLFSRFMAFLYYGNADMAVQYDIIYSDMTQNLATVQDLKQFHIIDLETSCELVEECLLIISDHLHNLSQGDLKYIRDNFQTANQFAIHAFKALGKDFNLIPELILATQIRMICQAYIYGSSGGKVAFTAFKKLILSEPMKALLNFEFGSSNCENHQIDLRKKVIKDLYMMMKVLIQWPSSFSKIEESKTDNLSSFELISSFFFSQNLNIQNQPFYLQQILELDYEYLQNASSLKSPQNILKHFNEILCIAIHNNILYSGSWKTIGKLDMSLNYCIGVFRGHSNWLRCLAIHNNILYSGSKDTTIRKWDISSDNVSKSLEGHSDLVECLAIHNNFLYSGSYDKTIRKWDITSDKCIGVFKEHSKNVNCLVIQKNTLFSGSSDGTIRKWDISTDQCNGVLRGQQGHTDGVKCLAINKNILYSGSSDGTIRKWDISSDQCIGELKEHTDGVNCLAIHNNILYSGSKDYTILKWDITSNKCIGALKGHSSFVKCLAIHKNILYSCSTDNTIRKWDIL